MLMSFFFMLLFLVSLLLLSQQSLGSVVEDTCKRAANSSPRIDYNFCVRSLQADPRSKSTNLTGLGLISLDLSTAKCSQASSRTRHLLNNSGLVSKEKKCLEDCLELYSDTMDTLEQCGDAYRAGRYSDVNVWVSAAIDDSSTCEEGFKESGLASPLIEENHDLTQLSAVVLAITKFLGA